MNKKDNKKYIGNAKLAVARYFLILKKIMTWCSCGAMGIDVCEGYIRIIGYKDNLELIKK